MRHRHRRCAICEILLKRTYRRKYCNDCVERYGRFMYNLWHRRAYQKRVGKEPDPLTYQSMIRTKPLLQDKTKRNEEMKKLRAQGISLSVIGAQFNLSKAGAHKVLRGL